MDLMILCWIIKVNKFYKFNKNDQIIFKYFQSSDNLIKNTIDRLQIKRGVNKFLKNENKKYIALNSITTESSKI